MCIALAYVRFTPESDIKRDIWECPLRAKSGLYIALRRWAAHLTIADALRLMTALVRYWIRLVAELNHGVRGFDAGRQERRQEHERAFDRLAVRHHRSDGQRPQGRDLIGARPSHRWIVDLVARRCELQHQLESDRST